MKNVCLDIGGTSIKYAVVQGETIQNFGKVTTDITHGREGILKSIHAAIDMAIQYADENCGIGIGSAGDIDCVNGNVIFATDNLPGYTGLQLAKEISSKYNRTVKVINDAHAGGLAEYAYGAGKNANSMVMITLGTGLGGTYIDRGKQLYGDNYRGLRLGHLTLFQGGRPCTCGKSGCVEQYVSATGFVATAKQLGVNANESTRIFMLAESGDEAAIAARDTFVEHLCMVLMDIINIFDPSKIIIGGGLIMIKEYWWEYMQTKMQNNADRIFPATLGNNAGVIGANIFLEKQE